MGKALVLFQVLWFLRCMAENRLDWRVFEGIDKYGENLSLICAYDKSSIEQPLDVLRWYAGQSLLTFGEETTNNTKYKSQIVPGGVKLTIMQCSLDDINKTYHCSIGFYSSEERLLSEKMIFNDEKNSTSNVPKLNVVDLVIFIIFCLVLVIYFVVGLFEEKMMDCFVNVFMTQMKKIEDKEEDKSNSMNKVYFHAAREYTTAEDLHDENFPSTDSSNNGGQNDHGNTSSDDHQHIHCNYFNTSLDIDCTDIRADRIDIAS